MAIQKTLNLYNNGNHAQTPVVTTFTVSGFIGMTPAGLAAGLAHILDGEMIKQDGKPVNIGGAPTYKFHFLAGSDNGKKARAWALTGSFQGDVTLEELAGFTGREDLYAALVKAPTVKATVKATPAVIPAPVAKVA